MRTAAGGTRRTPRGVVAALRGQCSLVTALSPLFFMGRPLISLIQGPGPVHGAVGACPSNDAPASGRKYSSFRPSIYFAKIISISTGGVWRHGLFGAQLPRAQGGAPSFLSIPCALTGAPRRKFAQQLRHSVQPALNIAVTTTTHSINGCHGEQQVDERRHGLDR